MSQSAPQPTLPSSPPPPIEPSSASGCGVKVPGCLIGCAVFLGLVLLAVGGAVWWFVAPGTQHPTDAAVGPESSGAFQVHDLGADEGVRDALEEVLREAQRRAPAKEEQASPSWLPKIGLRTGASGVAKILPREGTVSFEREAGRDEPVAVMVLNLRGLTRPLQMMLQGGDGPKESYRGVWLVSEEGGDVLFAMVDGTLVMADDRAAVQRTIDRLLDGTGEPVVSHMEILEEPPEGALLSGGTSFDSGELAEMVRGEHGKEGGQPPVDPAAFEAVRRLELMVDDVDPRAIRFRVGVGTDDQASVERAMAAVADLLRAELEPAALEITPTTSGSGGTLDVELTRWIEPVAEWLASDD